MKDRVKAGKKFERLVEILDVLRGENGCPWDKEQDEHSISNYFLEEVYEAVEAISQGEDEALAEELGDVLMEVVFLARIYKEKQRFTISRVLEGINQKMIRRHPHVFGNKKLKTSQKVIEQWHRQKKEEKKKESLFDGVAKSTASLLEAFQIGHRVSLYGFDWPHPLEALQKIKEEVVELEKALEAEEDEQVFHEIGDIFFSMANVSRLLGMNPEIALKHANRKFIQRFQHVEKRLKERGSDLDQADLKDMDQLWEEAKDKIR
jgi:MazG family protein